jgi:hypothetical protein
MVILSVTEPLEVSVEHCVSLPVAVDNIQFKLHDLITHMYIRTLTCTIAIPLLPLWVLAACYRVNFMVIY